MNSDKDLSYLQEQLEGSVQSDEISRIMYATDASAYKQKPLGVAYPVNQHDIKILIAYARENKITLIPRAAGTSLAGQVVGDGLVVDISRHMDQILEINKDEQWVRVQPGVNLEELNQRLKPLGYLFGPETSTANRCKLGGMLGNNACGLHSLVYGSTRDHTLSVKALLSDGTEAEFGSLSRQEFDVKCQGDQLENQLYRNIKDILSDKANQESIRKEYPDPGVKRRNTGYAIDLLLETAPFTETDVPFNFSKLIAGSEGTLAFVTEIKLHIVPIPAPVKGLLCVHFKSLKDALQGNLIALQHHPQAIELMDDKILELTKGNRAQMKNRFFLQGDPAAILIIEFAVNDKDELNKVTTRLEEHMREAGLGYHFPVVSGNDIARVWNLRKAGLGVLSNMPGDAKPVSVIEDTSVLPEKLPGYINDFNQLIKKHGLECVYHAHIATGELHLRPILNLKDPTDVEMFHTIARETAQLVKAYGGSLSGEHGDGRLRGEFIPLMVGEENYKLLQSIKATWDPDHIFNAGKIIDTPRMNTSLRYEPGKPVREIETYFDFSSTQGIQRAAEKCNGSGDCRKSALVGGTMCPSYMATRDEKHVTRARANVLREFLSYSTKKNPFDYHEIYEVMDLCLSCKACKSECPSSVDVAKLKAEFLQHYYDKHGIPLRSRIIANINLVNRIGSIVPSLFNFLMGSSLRKPFMNMLGFEPQRKMPLVHKKSMKRWMKGYVKQLNEEKTLKQRVYFFNDEFTNYNETDIGIKAVQLLTRLGYEVVIPKHIQSGRSFLSKGMLRKARKIANKNISMLQDLITEHTPLIGIEPSSILTFRDEYPELVNHSLQEASQNLAKNVMMFDEFIVQEFEKENIDPSAFTTNKEEILLHGHCQQKAVASTETTLQMLSIPANYTVSEIPSGCCGMAGSFGYEKEHYEVSMKVGELVLFPAVRNAGENTIISAPGTSCRQQIKDGTGRQAFHPVEVMHKAVFSPQ